MLSSLVIDGVLALDAGSIGSQLSFEDHTKIKAILLSHGHYDHIRGVPSFLFINSARVTRVYGLPHTLSLLTSRMMDGLVSPDFTDENSFLRRVAAELLPLTTEATVDIEDYTVTVHAMTHPFPVAGLEVVDAKGKSIFYSGDTGPGFAVVWERIRPNLLIIDVTFPDRLTKAAEDSSHLCPETFGRELDDFRRLRGYLPPVVTTHCSPRHEPEIAAGVNIVVERLGADVRIGREGMAPDVTPAST